MVIEIPGPIINGKQRFAKIEVVKHRVTSSVEWSVGGIDVDGIASDTFSARLQKAGMMETISQWLEDHYEKFSRNRSWGFGPRYGAVRRIPHNLAKELAALVAGFFRTAATELPVGME